MLLAGGGVTFQISPPCRTLLTELSNQLFLKLQFSNGTIHTFHKQLLHIFLLKCFVISWGEVITVRYCHRVAFVSGVCCIVMLCV